MASLSEKLRRERELRGISLKQISEDTKIGVRFLEALEEDKLELIPGEFYRRSYLRAYARYLGLDEERAVNAYAFAHQDERPEESDGEESTVARTPAWLPWLAVVAALAVGGIVVLRTQPVSDPVPPTEEASAPGDASVPGGESARAEDGNVITDANPNEELSEPPPAPVASPPVPVLVPSGGGAPPGGGLRLVLTVREPCWLEIEVDGEIATTGLKERGFRREVTADSEVRLWLGNAGGVSLWVNDLPLRSLGRAGQVRKDLSITPDNFMDYVDRDVSTEPETS